MFGDALLFTRTELLPVHILHGWVANYVGLFPPVNAMQHMVVYALVHWSLVDYARTKYVCDAHIIPVKHNTPTHTNERYLL